MATFPSYSYAIANYTLTVEPAVRMSERTGGSTRQRKLYYKKNDIFDITLHLTDAQMSSFRTFVRNDINVGDEFTVHYFDSDVSTNGTGLLVEGRYTSSYLVPGYWEVKYKLEIIDRDMTEKEEVYDFINGYGGFDGLKELFDALENMVNNNNLNA